jgi:hypothetical protein
VTSAVRCAFFLVHLCNTFQVQDARLMFWNTLQVCASVAPPFLVAQSLSQYLQERSPARVQGLGAFCHSMTFDWRGEHVITADDNLTTGAGTEIKTLNPQPYPRTRYKGSPMLQRDSRAASCACGAP